MPMFDDPREELRRLQAELLAAEEEDYDEDLEEADTFLEDCEEDYEEDCEEDYHRDWEEDFEDDYAEDYTRQAYRRRNYGVDHSDALLELEEDDTVLYRDEFRKLRKRRTRKIRRLLFIVFLEILAILAILGWWVSWLR